MPIRSERKALYPTDWKDIRLRILERADNRCELCGVINGRPIRRIRRVPQLYEYNGEPPRDPRRHMVEHFGEIEYCDPVCVVITIHHVNDDPTDNRDCNLLALCQRCHLKLDASYKDARRRRKGE